MLLRHTASCPSLSLLFPAPLGSCGSWHPAPWPARAAPGGHGTCCPRKERHNAHPHSAGIGTIGAGCRWPRHQATLAAAAATASLTTLRSGLGIGWAALQAHCRSSFPLLQSSFVLQWVPRLHYCWTTSLSSGKWVLCRITKVDFTPGFCSEETHGVWACHAKANLLFSSCIQWLE